jgi:hypothetical protein
MRNRMQLAATTTKDIDVKSDNSATCAIIIFMMTSSPERRRRGADCSEKEKRQTS